MKDFNDNFIPSQCIVPIQHISALTTTRNIVNVEQQQQSSAEKQ
jgi:hypothetical protein